MEPCVHCGEGIDDNATICPKCGKEVDSKMAFCPYCGTKIPKGEEIKSRK